MIFLNKCQIDFQLIARKREDDDNEEGRKEPEQNRQQDEEEREKVSKPHEDKEGLEHDKSQEQEQGEHGEPAVQEFDMRRTSEVHLRNI